MDLGTKITELRKQNNLTQDQLGKELNISAQAVSKWERNLSEPDLYAIKAMSNIFHVSIDTLINDNNDLPVVETEIAKTTLECSHCHKTISKDDAYQLQPSVLCKECRAEVEKQIKDLTSTTNKKEENETKVENKIHKHHFSLLFKFLLSGVISLVLLVLGLVFGDSKSALDICGTIITTLVIFTFLFQVFSETIIQDIVFGSFGKSIQMPGVIFSLDIDSILFMLAYKFIVAPIIVFLVGVVVFIGGLLLALIISPFTFFFTLPGVIEDCKDDDKDKLKNNIKNVEKE